MKDINIKLPLYLGIFFLVITILTVSIKVGERTMVQTGIIEATQNKANVSLIFTQPDIVSLNLASTNEVGGGDFVIKFDPNVLEILPSTLFGLSGYVTTGGIINSEKNTFSFSIIKGDNAIRNGIPVNFRIQQKILNQNSINKIHLNFDSSSSQLLDVNSKLIQTDFIGID